MSRFEITVEGRRTIIDDIAKTAAFIDNAGAATVVHPTEDTVVVKANGSVFDPVTGAPVTLPPERLSEIAVIFTGRQDATKGPTVTTGEREVRQQFTLPGLAKFTAPATRSVVEWNGQGAGLMSVTTTKAGIHRIKMAGLPSGALTGAVAFIEGGVERQVGDDNLDSFDVMTKPMAAGETFDISINKRGGDNKTEVAIEPL